MEGKTKLIFWVASIVLLATVFVAVALFVAGQEEPTFTVNSSEYPDEPERIIEVTCTDQEMTPNSLTISSTTFVRFVFSNQGSEKQRFGVRATEGSRVFDSTMAIAPNTLGNIRWRVPAESFEAQMYCSDHPSRADDLIGAVSVSGNE